MGAWGCGPFENDAAVDLLIDLALRWKGKRVFRGVLRSAHEQLPSGIDQSTASEIIAIAALCVPVASDAPGDEDDQDTLLARQNVRRWMKPAFADQLGCYLDHIVSDPKSELLSPGMFKSDSAYAKWQRETQAVVDGFAQWVKPMR